MIKLESIEKIYSDGSRSSTAVLRGIDLHVRQGEYVSIMGPSGSGKTTLMNIIGCLDKPSGGRYLLDEIDTLELDDSQLASARNRKIGFVFQLFHLLQHTTVLKNVLLPLIYAEQYPADAEQRARDTLATVGLADKVNARPNTLSGGEQQRVAIARALITSPSILLADEPTGNLDSESGAEIMELFGRLHSQGRTIIIVTHNRSVAELTDRTCVLDRGLISSQELHR
jgi:putative ABC transport system ATP-binding protein